MTSRLLIGALALTTALTGFGSPVLAESESDGGYFDFFSNGGKIGKRFVEWIWAPHYFPGDIDYFISLKCERTDAFGVLTGNNKVIVKDIAFFGLDSDGVIEFKKVSQKLGKFHDNGYLFLNAPDLELLANDDFVLASLRFDVKGKSDDDRIKCSADVTEEPILGAATKARVKPAPERSLLEVLRERPPVR